MTMPDNDPRPLLAGVCGFPVAHSKSPVLFGHWFDRMNVSGQYVRLRIAPERFLQVLPALAHAGFRGVNVTVPHKLAVLEIADTISPAAQAIGAANTVTFQQDGTIHADNSDGYGFIQNLRHGAPDWQPAGAPALLVGAGGAARAAIHALLQAGVVQLRILNRTREKAETLATHFGPACQVIDWQDRHDSVGDCGLIVNTTSLGMSGQPPLDLSLDRAPATAIVHDIVYSPLETDLLGQARARGLLTVDGLGMLLHQARPGFRAWFGSDPEVTPALRTACLGGAS